MPNLSNRGMPREMRSSWISVPRLRRRGCLARRPIRKRLPRSRRQRPLRPRFLSGSVYLEPKGECLGARRLGGERGNPGFPSVSGFGDVLRGARFFDSPQRKRMSLNVSECPGFASSAKHTPPPGASYGLPIGSLVCRECRVWRGKNAFEERCKSSVPAFSGSSAESCGCGLEVGATQCGICCRCVVVRCRSLSARLTQDCMPAKRKAAPGTLSGAAFVSFWF